MEDVQPICLRCTPVSSQEAFSKLCENMSNYRIQEHKHKTEPKAAPNSHRKQETRGTKTTLRIPKLGIQGRSWERNTKGEACLAASIRPSLNS